MQQILETLQKSKLLSDVLIEADGKVRQIKGQLTDQAGGFCAIGLLMHSFGWNGRFNETDSGISSICEDKVIDILGGKLWYDIIEMNNSGNTFGEIGRWLAEVHHK